MKRIVHGYLGEKASREMEPRPRIEKGPSSLRVKSLLEKEVKETEVGSKTEPKLSISDEYPSLQEEVRNAKIEDDITYICSYMLIFCCISVYKTCDIMLRVWAATIVHVHKLQENDDEDDLKINIPGITPDDMITDDPGDVVVDTSEHDRSVYKVKLDQEVYNKGTVDDPAAEITGTTDGVEEEPVAVKSSSYKTVEPMEKIHHAGIEEAGYKYDDDAAPNMMMMQQ